MKLAKPVHYFTALILAAAGFVTSCVPRHSVPAHLRDLSYDPNAKNVALLFGAANGLPGIQDDLNHMKAVLEDPQGGNAFEVVVINDASRQQILEATQDAAVSVGETGTLFWYFSGHGAGSGELMTAGGALPFAQITDMIRAVRQTPVKRMYAMFDSCFSGQMVDGSAAINGLNYPGNRLFNQPQTTLALAGGTEVTDQYMKDVAENYADIAAGSFYDQSEVAKLSPQAYEQLIVMSASQQSQTSLAGSEGSKFTNAVAGVFSNFKTSRPQATIGEFLEAVKSETVRLSGGHHTPAFRVMPEQQVMSDTLFAKPRQQNLQPGAQPAPNGAPGVGMSRSMALAIGPGSATNGAARLYVATDASVSRIGLCSGRKEACLRNPQVFLEFRAAGEQTVIAPVPAGAVVFESSRPVAIEAAKPVTFLGFDASGKVVSSRTIQFRRNG